jgi:hypothetical protein
MFSSVPNAITLGQEEGTGGEFHGSIFGLFGAGMESFGFGVWLDVGRTTFERLTCLPSNHLDFLAQQSRVTHHELFLFYGNGGSQRLRIRGLGC